MKNFIKLVLAAFLGTFLSLMFVVLFFVIIMVSAIKAMDPFIDNVFKDIDITNKGVNKENNVLFIKLEGNLIEHYSMENPFANKHNTNINYILNKIDKAKNDKYINVISLEFENPSISITHASIIRRKLMEFKKANKKIYSYANYYSQNEYYLASVSDSLFINKLGYVDFKGLYAEWLFFKRIQQYYGIKMDIIRHGKYKSAVEPFLSNKLSKENKHQIKQLLSSLWGKMISEISEGRNISKNKLEYIANNLISYSSKELIDNKMIDDILSKDEYDDLINNTAEYYYNNKSYNITVEDKYKKSKSSENQIALIYALGTINNYKKNATNEGIYADEINKTLDKLSYSSRVKAIVIRIDSPGGDALASDLIWEKIKEKSNSKPIVISMGANAASGGYYIACAGSYIFAEETTITGSIGVWGAIPNAEKFFNKIGIDTDYVETNQNSFTYSIFKGASNKVKNVIKKNVQNVYDVFLDRVSESRKLSYSYVDSIGQGRIWTGADALRLKLVDEIGGLEEAIKKAAQMSFINEYQLKKYPQYDTNFRDILINLFKENMNLYIPYPIHNNKSKKELKSLEYLIKNINNVNALNIYSIK